MYIKLCFNKLDPPLLDVLKVFIINTVVITSRNP